MTARATLVLANHRPETLATAYRLMRTHDAIILEEPPDPQFDAMLSGRINIEAYLETQEIEYPVFARRMAEMLRERHRAGVPLHQVEPFLELLLAVHQRFADGQGPADLPRGTVLQQVYWAERDATKALIDFYDRSTTGNLETVVASVKRFARADARRFALRDRLRAKKMIDLLLRPGRTYIEAGQMHYPLWWELRRYLPAGYPLKVHFLMKKTVRALGHRRHLYGPGDLLTLYYRCHPKGRNAKTDLLAARALIYNKMIRKEEMRDGQEAYPHTRDELAVAELTERLSMEDCRRLFPAVRRVTTQGARSIVQEVLARRHQGTSKR